jgi:hypothetical protein
MMRLVLLFILTGTCLAQGYLTSEDQKYFKNDSMDGKNNLERIDQNVKQINNLIQELNQLKTRVDVLEKKLKAQEGSK